MNEIQKELLHTLSILTFLDCDLKSITICMNPNHINGSDKEYSQIILKGLNKLIKMNLIEKKRRKINVCTRSGKNKNKWFVLYELIK